MFSEIIGVGSYLPERIVTNFDLEKEVETSDEWIVERTGIKQRHFAADNELTSTLAYNAAMEAIKDAGVNVDEIDMVVLATTTPDNVFPSTATKVQGMLGIHQGFAFDVQAVCSGFLYGLSCADNAIRNGQAKVALVIGAETFTRLLDNTDRNTYVLFGDGAGAVVLRATENEDSHIVQTVLKSDGRFYDALYVDGGVSTTRSSGFVKMNGKEVFKHAVTNMSSAVNEILENHKVTSDDINWIVPHQANMRIISGVAKKLGLEDEKVIVTVDGHANTSAASIPLALTSGVKSGKIKKNDYVILTAMGGGFTWGASLIKW
ncbi:MAG: 3-oxoacyl-(acyl-carrier-protein) synthase 3 [Alphaproteobacteria bacterium ADurb.Bin438]|nr:MAG: 3-oxoacyl-(acyl-carrier-protein) synthase 3 [Alphaproteobacteria bacterium ADurb.Bin438]